MKVLENLGHKLLLRLPPELAHDIGIVSMKERKFAPGRYIDNKGITLFGNKLDNPIGLAAGFDKNADIVDQAQDYGFGFIEIGSVTYCGAEGNPKPRLFRLRKDKSLGNRMGLNGLPAIEIANKLKRVKNSAYGVNIAKSNRPEIVGDAAIEDMKKTYIILQDFGLYDVINISCPNTKDGRTFEEPSSLEELLSEINNVKKDKPKLIKLSPNLSEQRLDKIMEVSEKFVDGYVCGNTLPSVSANQELQWIFKKYGKVGISGEILKPYSIRLIAETRKRTEKTIIGCGGISNGADAFNALKAGADLIEIYTGFIYGGIDTAHRINEELRISRINDRQKIQSII